MEIRAKNATIDMTKETKNVMGMETEEWVHKSCTASFGVGENWATLYYIHSEEEGKGHATELLIEAKAFYEGKGKKFGGTVSLNPRMSMIYKKLNIHEYK